MDIKDYFNIIWRRKWVVIVTTMAAMMVTVWGTSRVVPVYQAAAIMRVAATAGGSLNYTASTYSNQLLNTTAQIANSRPIQEEVMKRLALIQPPIINAEVISSTELIRITVEYSDPKTAAQIANTLADILIVKSNELYTGGQISSQDVLAEQIAQYKADLDQARKEYDAIIALSTPSPEKADVAFQLLQLKQRNYEQLLMQYDEAHFQKEMRTNMMTIVEPAIAPELPIHPQIAYNYLLGFAGGLFGGIVLAFMAESFDSTLYSAKDIDRVTEIPAMARIPKTSKKNVLMTADDNSSLAEAFRNLALNIMFTDHQKTQKVILVMGAEPEQGKSTVVYNLAIALAEFGKSVVAVDCDMRLSKLHTLFNISNENGLNDVLVQTDKLKNALTETVHDVSVIASGRQPANPSQLLGSPQMAQVINNLRQKYDYVLLDTPALLAVSDTMAILQNTDLAKNLDVILLVVRQSYAKRESVQTASKFLKSFPQLCMGVVLNNVKDTPSYNYYRHVRDLKRI